MSLPVGHSVVVSGYYCESDGTNYIQIVDSNEGKGKRWLSLNGDTNTFCYHYSGIHYYTYWDWSVYAQNV